MRLRVYGRLTATSAAVSPCPDEFEPAAPGVPRSADAEVVSEHQVTH